MKKAKLSLIENKAIDSPYFIVKLKDPNKTAVVIPPVNSGNNSVADTTALVRGVCSKVDPREVTVQMNTYTYNGDSPLPAGEALLVSIEDANSVDTLMLPYEQKTDGAFDFKKEVWVERDFKIPGHPFEGFVS